MTPLSAGSLSKWLSEPVRTTRGWAPPGAAQSPPCTTSLPLCPPEPKRGRCGLRARHPAPSAARLHSRPPSDLPTSPDSPTLPGLSFSTLGPPPSQSKKPTPPASSTHPTPVARSAGKPGQRASDHLPDNKRGSQARPSQAKGLRLCPSLDLPARPLCATRQHQPRPHHPEGLPTPITQVHKLRLREERPVQSTAGTEQSWGWDPALQMPRKRPQVWAALSHAPQQLREGEQQLRGHTAPGHSQTPRPAPAHLAARLVLRPLQH